MSRAVAALALSEFKAAAEAVADARAAFLEAGEAGGEAGPSREGVLAGLEEAIAAEAERDQTLALALQGKEGGFTLRPFTLTVTLTLTRALTLTLCKEGGFEPTPTLALSLAARARAASRPPP